MNNMERHPSDDQQGGNSGNSMDQELLSFQFPIEHKMFYIDLKANNNGLYVKISEKSGGRRHNVLVPASGLRQVYEALGEALQKIDEAAV